MKRILFYFLMLSVVSLVTHRCGEDEMAGPEEPPVVDPYAFKDNLSEYNFFTGEMVDLNPASDLIPYDLTTSLFTDYAYKARFIQIPEDSTIQFKGDGLLDFPIGTIIIKNFYYWNDERDKSLGKKVLETRLLQKDDEGVWNVAVYIWNNAQTEATRKQTGAVIAHSWINKSGKTLNIDYEVPGDNDCKGCHKLDARVIPIGPKSRALNRNFDFSDGTFNQLEKMKDMGVLEGLTSASLVTVLPDWEDVSESLDKRARAYLDMNCAHCHNAKAAASNSGLFLEYEQANSNNLGICKKNVSGGPASGKFPTDIIPGSADSSFLYIRMNSNETEVAMPEIGRTIIHTEGVQLIEDWINSLSGNCN